MKNKNQIINKFANHIGYSDVNPYEVVKVISKLTVEIRQMDTKQTVFPKQFEIGGFSAHCSDNYNQEYIFTSRDNYPTIRIRWSKANNRWQHSGMTFRMSDTPEKFYDYNF